MSMRSIDGTERDEVELLLPWYVTGKLDAGDRARVEAALGREPELRRQLEIIREEMAETVAVNEALGGPSPASVDSIMERVGREVRPAAGGAVADWIKGLFASPQALQWAAVAALVVMLAQAAVIGTLLAPGGTYGTAGGGTSDGSYAIVRFKADAPIGRIGDAMNELGMTIEGGPKAGGLYTVRIGAKGLDEGARAERIASLRARGEIVELVIDSK